MEKEEATKGGRKISGGPAVGPRSLGSFWITAATFFNTATSFTASPREERDTLMLTRWAQNSWVPCVMEAALMVPGAGWSSRATDPIEHAETAARSFLHLPHLNASKLHRESTPRTVNLDLWAMLDTKEVGPVRQ